MSKFGFDKIISRIPSLERQALRSMMEASQNEFERNFATETDGDTGIPWNDVKRSTQYYPILDVTGKLLKEVKKHSNVRIFPNRATLTIDPIDKRGRGYADYHQDGFKHLQAGWVPPRKYVTPDSPRLVQKCKDIILENCRIIFNDF